MTGRKNRALQVPLVVPYKALEKFSKALYGVTGGTSSARFFRPVMTHGKLQRCQTQRNDMHITAEIIWLG